jgi:hypothetical protein
MSTKIHEEVIVLKLYKLIKIGKEGKQIVTPEFIENLISVAEELVGNGVVIEAEL